jgi:hypothetical protein
MPGTPYRTITTPDADATSLPMILATGAAAISVGATCSIVGCQLTYRVLSFDPGGNVVGSTEQILLKTRGNPELPAKFIGVPPPLSNPSRICGDHCAVIVDSVTGGGTWTMYVTLAVIMQVAVVPVPLV